MRPPWKQLLWGTSLVVLGLTATGQAAGDDFPGLPKVPVGKTVEVRGPGSWYFRGCGKTEELAVKEALGRAVAEVNDYLVRQNPRLRWRATEDFLRDSGLVMGRQVEGVVKIVDEPELQVRLAVEVGEPQYQQILRQDRKYQEEQRKLRAQQRKQQVLQRQLLLGKGLAGLIALLAAVAGYLRLDEMTKGYYTNWLRVAAVGFVGAVGAVLVLIRWSGG
jgi:hypothetical protein